MTDRGSYDTAPAARWEDAYPVGNGRHGALVHGDPWDELVIVNHHHLVWPAFPDRPAAPPDLSHRLEEARDLLLAGASAAALALLTDGWPDCPPHSFHPAFAVRLRDAGRGPAGAMTATPPASRRRPGFWSACCWRRNRGRTGRVIEILVLRALAYQRLGTSRLRSPAWNGR